MQFKNSQVTLKVVGGLMATATILALASTACGGDEAPGESSQNTTLPAARFQEVIDAAVERGVPGMVLRVETIDGEGWSGAAGVRSLGGEAMSADTPFPIFSIAKMVTAATTLSLAEDGIIGLDDPITKWLSAASLSGLPNTDRITIRQLLMHTSGIREYWDDAFVEQVVAEPGRRWRPQELVALAAAGEPFGSPGSSVAEYANTNYTLLGLIIEKATGSPLATALRDRVFRPLGMNDTSSWEEGVRETQAVGYFAEGGELIDVSGLDLSVAWACGGLVSTTRDVATLTQAIFAGSLLSDTTRAEMLSVFNPMKGADRIVYGMGVARIDAFGPPLFGHMGDGPGHGTIAMFDPANGVTVVVLTNIGMAEAQVEPFIEVMNVLTGGNVSTR